MKRNESFVATTKGLVTLIIVIMAVAPTLTIMVTCEQSQQTRSPTNTAREGSPPTSAYWARTYGGNDYDDAYSVEPTSDGGYIVAGYTHSSGAGGNDFWVLKLDSAGSVEWQKTYGGNGDDEAYSVNQTTDGGYVVAGYTESFGAGHADFWVLKLNSTGGVTWQKTYGGSGYDYAESVGQTSDGGYVVAGYTESFGAGGYDAWVLKLNSSGSVEWQKTYGGNVGDIARSVEPTSDGGYIVAGYAKSFGAGNSDFWVLKLDSVGSVTWQKTYGYSTFDEAYSVESTSDGGYIVAGHRRSYPDASYSDFWVLKLDSVGSVTWQKTYGGSSYDWAESVESTSDGGYVVAGFTSSFGAGHADFWVLKLDSAGSVTWQKTYGGNGNDGAESVEQTSNGDYVVAGATDSFGAGADDFWVLRLNSSGSMVWEGDGGASTHTTSITPSDTSATISATSVTPANSAGTVQDTHVTPEGTHATVTVQAGADTIPPAAIADLATSNPTENSITLKWTAVGDDGNIGNATGYVVKYSTTGAITDANWSSATTYTQSWTPAKNGTSETHVLTGLTPGTKYWFAVEAYDDASPTSNYGGTSNSPSATTAAPPPVDYTTVLIAGGAAALVVVVAAVAVVLRKRTKT